jgi:hypothetical protein
MSRPISFERACAKYPHRYTMEHVPDWARHRAPGGQFYAPQYRSDREWYDLTKFPGELPKAFFFGGHCYSTGQTWPRGHWLDRPFQRSQRLPDWAHDNGDGTVSGDF